MQYPLLYVSFPAIFFSSAAKTLGTKVFHHHAKRLKSNLFELNWVNFSCSFFTTSFVSCLMNGMSVIVLVEAEIHPHKVWLLNLLWGKLFFVVKTLAIDLLLFLFVLWFRYGSPHHTRSQSVKTPGSRASGNYSFHFIVMLVNEVLMVYFHDFRTTQSTLLATTALQVVMDLNLPRHFLQSLICFINLLWSFIESHQCQTQELKKSTTGFDTFQ